VAGDTQPGATPPRPGLADIRLAEGPFAPEEEMARFRAAHLAAGGVVGFIGQVRAGGDVVALELSHYPPLTLPGMQALAAAALARWPLAGLLVVHRVGLLLPGAPIVLVCAAARHRRDAFAAADYTMDHLKSAAWFWKREQRAGQWHWVEPRDQDSADLARWG